MKEMLKLKFLLIIAGFTFGFNSQAQTVIGKWHTINEETGKPNSLIEIFEEDGEVKGKVLRILKEEDRDKICNNCSGNLKDQPIEGLELMTGFQREGDEYTGGIITDPKSGKEYKAKLWLDEDNPQLLKVRGYIAFFYKTQTWQRAE